MTARKVPRMEWDSTSESFKASCRRIGFGDELDDIIIEESTQDTNMVECEGDDQDEEVTRRSPACLVMIILATTAAAAAVVVSHFGFHFNSRTKFSNAAAHRENNWESHITWSAAEEYQPNLPRSFFLLSGQSNIIGHTTSEQSIGGDGEYWNGIKTILDESIAPSDVTGDILSTMEANLYNVIYDANYEEGQNIDRVAKTLSRGVMDLYKSSLLSNLTTPLTLGKCSFTEVDDLGVYNVSNGTVPITWNANCGYSFGHELLFSRTLELGMNYTTEFEMHKVARGGSDLYEHWYPNHGQHWDLLKNAISSQGYGDWKGFIWHQGSQAALSVDQYGEDRTLTYLGNLTGLINEVRNLMFHNSVHWQCKEEIPVIIVQLGHWPHRSINAAGQRVRDAQAEFCNNDPRAALVQTSDLSKFYHYDAASFLISGNRVAHAYQKAMEGVAECPSRAPSSSPSKSKQSSSVMATSNNMLGSPSGTVKQQQTDEQMLLEIAENIAAACGGGDFSQPFLRTRAETSTSAGMEMCRELCRHHMCCVLEEDDDQYSCASDPSKNCAVYVGCEALVYYSAYRQREVWD